MAFIQIAAMRSMRDGLRCIEAVGSRLNHWGLETVAHSNCRGEQTRSARFFMDMFAEMNAICAAKAPKHNFRFKSKLFSLDATTIKLCLSLFPWASFRQSRGGIKMRTLRDHDGHSPSFTTVTDARTHESRIPCSLELPKGSIVVFDKSFISHTWFRSLGERGIFLWPVSNATLFINSWDVARWIGNRNHIRPHHWDSKPGQLWRIGYRDLESGRRYKFLTSHFQMSPKTTAVIYKERWKIELFFRGSNRICVLKALLATQKMSYS